jgi:hypothetical protein
MRLPRLACLRVMRLVTVMLLGEFASLYVSWIVVSCEALLIPRQRGWRRGCGAIPSLPIGMSMRPVRSPDTVPARWSISRPTAEYYGRIEVIAHRDAQDEERYAVEGDKIPWAVEPGADIPCVVDEDPVEAIIEEVVRMEAWCVIHRVAGDPL